MLDEARKENKDLEESLSDLEKEIESLHSRSKPKAIGVKSSAIQEQPYLIWKLLVG